MGRLLADFILGICWLVSVIFVNNFKRCLEILALWQFGTNIEQGIRSGVQLTCTVLAKIWRIKGGLKNSTFCEFCLSIILFFFLSHVSQSVRDGFPRKKTTVLLLVPNCPLLTLGAKLSGVKIVLHSSLKQHTAPVADYKWNSPCLVGLRALALSPVVSAVHNVNYNTNGQLTHERCTCSFAIEMFV